MRTSRHLWWWIHKLDLCDLGSMSGWPTYNPKQRFHERYMYLNTKFGDPMSNCSQHIERKAKFSGRMDAHTHAHMDGQHFYILRPTHSVWRGMKNIHMPWLTNCFNILRHKPHIFYCLFQIDTIKFYESCKCEAHLLNIVTLGRLTFVLRNSYALGPYRCSVRAKSIWTWL